MATLWTEESIAAYNRLREERAQAYHNGEYELAIERAVDASEIAIANEDPLRNAINVRDTAFARHRLGNYSEAWYSSTAAIDLTLPLENQDEYRQYVNFVPVLYPRREQAANHLARLRVALRAIKDGVEIDGFYSSHGDNGLIAWADADYAKFHELLVVEGDRRPDQYEINAQQDRMLLKRMHGRLGLGTYLSCMRMVSVTESRFVRESPSRPLLSPSRLKIVCRQAGKITQNLFTHR